MNIRSATFTEKADGREALPEHDAEVPELDGARPEHAELVDVREEPCWAQGKESRRSRSVK